MGSGIITNFHAEAEGMTSDKVVEKLLAEVTEPTAAAYA
jgi:hypothetical protein